MFRLLFKVAIILMFIINVFSFCFADQIHDAAAQGDLKTIKILVEKNGIDINAKEYGNIRFNGMTALHYAVDNNKLEIVNYLISKKANVDIKTDNGITPLFFAKTHNIAFLLIQNQANVNIKNNFGSTPLHFAADGGYLEVIKLLVENGADINALNNNRYTALIYACGKITSNHYEIVKYLLSKKADTTIVSKEGLSALKNAQKNNNQKVIKLLLNE